MKYKGLTVIFEYAGCGMRGVIAEDRGNIGYKGRHLLRVRVDAFLSYPKAEVPESYRYIELSADRVTIVE